MRRFIKLTAAFLCAASVFSCVACDKTTVQGQDFALSHFDGSQTENGYDTDLLYKNNSNLLGGDSGVIWVSEEQDPVYGGYFYQYQSSTVYTINEPTGNLSGVPSTEEGKTPTNSEEVAYVSHIATTRSKDLNDWELCGALDGGFSLKLQPDSWIYTYIWAAEVIYDPVSTNYFMYFNAGTVRDTKHFYGGVAISETPVGPFELVTSENYYGDATQPNPNGQILTHTKATINFEEWYGLPDDSIQYEYVADFHPMLDENGELYLYFNKRSYDPSIAVDGSGNPVGKIGVWGMKMKDFATPDYSTITCIMACQSPNGSLSPVRSVYKGDKANNAPITAKDQINETYYNDPAYPRYLSTSWSHLDYWEDGTQNKRTLTDGSKNPDYNGTMSSQTVREGIQVIRNEDSEGRTVYYATFTFVGVGSTDYDVHYATSYSPLGVTGDEYTLPKGTGLGTILGADGSNDFMSNLGHVQFLNVDGEWWIAHWEWTVPFGYSPSTDIGRIYALSQMTWIEDDRVDFYVPVANGPSKKLQALPSIYTGYKNVAGEATVTATNAIGDSAKYLTDGHVVTMAEWQDRELRANGSTTITLTFDTPRTIRGLLIYNSYSEAHAFSKVSHIQFDLAETPVWRKAGSEKSCYITDLGYDNSVYLENGLYQSGGASVATFNEIKVNKITITINSKLKSGKELRVSDIKILGK